MPLRLHQRKGSLAGADLAGTVRAIRLPAEVGDRRARFPGRAGSLTGAVLPRPPRRLCLQRHDTARDKVIFACGPCRSVALQGMGHNHLLTGGSGPFLRLCVSVLGLDPVGSELGMAASSGPWTR